MAQLSNMIERSLLFKRKYIEEKESEYSPRNRVIAIYKTNKRVLIYFKNKNEFLNYIQNLYFPFFYNNNLEPIFLKYSYSTQQFWDKINYKIIYETPPPEDYLNQNTFLEIVTLIIDQLITFGPVVSGFDVYRDFII